jgi:hypothetical protein
MDDIHSMINKTGLERAVQNAQLLSLLNKMIRIYKGETQ